MTRPTKKPVSGWYWHVHHNRLMEWCYDYEGRVAYISHFKPPSQVKLRLRLFQPASNVPAALDEVGRVYGEAQLVYNEALEADREAWRAHPNVGQANEEGQRIRYEAARAYSKAWRAYVEAREAYNAALRPIKPELQRLHAVQCPDCPWNGETIFPECESV